MAALPSRVWPRTASLKRALRSGSLPRLMAQNTQSTTASRATVPGTANDAPVEPSLFTARREYIADAKRVGDGAQVPELAKARELFADWLRAHYSGKLKHVLSLLRSAREGKLYDSRFGARMTGSGPYAWMIRRRFEAAAARLGLGRSRVPLRCDLFRPPARTGEQMRLF